MSALQPAAGLWTCASSHARLAAPSLGAPHRGRRRWTVQCAADGGSYSSAPQLPAVQGPKHVLVLGGTGRVGSSTAAALAAALPDIRLTLGSRTRASYEAALAARPELAAAGAVHAAVDAADASTLSAALSSGRVDLVVHAAGPFQRAEGCTALEAAIRAGVPYLDVCDDTRYSQRAKALGPAAAAAGVPAITTGGIYPGVSNVMAAHMISIARKEYATDWACADDAPLPGAAPQPRRLLYSYFTAGSGGAGPTILETSLLLAGEPVTVFKDGQPVTVPAVSNPRVVDFGVGVGRRSVYLYALPEVLSGRQVFGVPSVSARFGTAPDFWNWAMVAVARLAPKGMLEDRRQVARLAALADPLVRAVDGWVGEAVGMLVEVELSDGTAAAGLYVHDRLSDAVGVCTAAFARCMLAGHTSPGVWFPEERPALSDRRALLAAASAGTRRFVLNKPPWSLETDPLQLGMGFYW